MYIDDYKLTPRAKDVLKLAGKISREWGHHYIGVEHLACAVLRLDQGITAMLCKQADITEQKVKKILFEI